MNEKQQRSTANVARTCDSCTRRRARWYCAADDAFLCQPCDASVHSANPLARRHRRLRLNPSIDTAPAWHQGFTRKIRTPRHHHRTKKSEPLVPDLEETYNTEEEEQLLYQVPIFDPAVAEFYSPPVLDEVKPAAAQLSEFSHASAGLGGFRPSETEMEEFAADVDILLGRTLDNEAFYMEDLGLADAREGPDTWRVKMELDVAATVDLEMETALDINFNYYGSIEEVGEGKEEGLNLRLDYEAVVAAWSGRGGSPWMDGERPRLNFDDRWPEYMVGGGGEVVGGSGDGGRVARVTRYREKRQTRLFSKKIRYEVRKLNAEKRPRMKGRFVKRASFPPNSLIN